MSVPRDRFESEVRQPQPNWETALDNLSALAMFEMLPTLAGLQPIQRDEVARQASRIFATQRGWLEATERIEFAVDVIKDRRLTSWPRSIPEDQVEDARNFLIGLLRPANSRADRASFPTAEAAGVAAIQEINPTSIAVDLEFSGAVFQQGRLFGFTPPKKGKQRESDPFVPAPPNTSKVGVYHTHAASTGGGAEIFSIDDREICKQLSKSMGHIVFGFLGTPRGSIQVFTPRPNEPGIGNGFVLPLRQP